MKTVPDLVIDSARHPIQAIQLVVALIGFCIGMFVISPFFFAAASPAIAQSFNSLVIGKVIVGVFVVLPTLPTLLGVVFERFRTIEWYSRSAFYMFISFLFLLLLRLVTIGIYPIVWIPLLAIVMIIAICWIYWRSRA